MEDWRKESAHRKLPYDNILKAMTKCLVMRAATSGIIFYQEGRSHPIFVPKIFYRVPHSTTENIVWLVLGAYVEAWHVASLTNKIDPSKIDAI